MEFNAVEYIENELTEYSSLCEHITNVYNNFKEDIFKEFSTIKGGYVENSSVFYKKIENITKPFNLQGSSDKANAIDSFQNDYTNYTNIFGFADKYRGFSGNVDNFVDNGVKTDDNFKLIHNYFNIAENLIKNADSCSKLYDAIPAKSSLNYTDSLLDYGKVIDSANYVKDSDTSDYDSFNILNYENGFNMINHGDTESLSMADYNRRFNMPNYGDIEGLNTAAVGEQHSQLNEYYRGLNEVFKSVNNNSENNNVKNSVNINLGGITQNFASQDSDDVVDILVDKLRMALSGFGDGVYR